MNPLRGEAEVKIGDCTFVIAATMEAMARLSASTNCATLQDLYNRLIGTELFVTLAAIRSFVQSGTDNAGSLLVDSAGRPLARDVVASRAAGLFSLSDVQAVQDAFVKVLSALTRPAPEGNDGDKSGNAAPASA